MSKKLKLLRSLEWSGRTSDQDHRLIPCCPMCGGIRDRNVGFIDSAVGHRPDCELEEAIK